MKNIINMIPRLLISLILFLTAIVWLDSLMVDYQVHHYDYSLRTAVADATYIVKKDTYKVAKNMNFDGFQNEATDLFVDKESALKQFNHSLYLNVSNRKIGEYELPVRGIVSHDGIEIYTTNDGWLIKEYFFYDHSGTRYLFTLGNELQTRNLVTMESKEYLIGDISQIRNDMTNEQLKNYVIMTTIKNAVNRVLISEKNLQTLSEGYGMKIRLSIADRIDNGAGSIYDYRSNVIEGPCFFAVIDDVSLGISGQRKYRKVEIGGAELKLSN